MARDLSAIDDFLYWAVIAHCHAWLYYDGVELYRVGADGAGFDRRAVRRIATLYRVNRAIRRSKNIDGKDLTETDSAADWYVCRLKDEARTWPVGLVARAERCRRVASDAATDGHTRGEAVSAVTKLMWFLKPDGWTVFDNLAATGLGTPMTRSFDRMPQFYRMLSEKGFIDLAREINAALDASAFEKLFGERVIDNYLMLMGSDDARRRDTVANSVGFIASLPQETARALESVARRISDKFGRDPFGLMAKAVAA